MLGNPLIVPLPRTVLMVNFVWVGSASSRVQIPLVVPKENDAKITFASKCVTQTLIAKQEKFAWKELVILVAVRILVCHIILLKIR